MSLAKFQMEATVFVTGLSYLFMMNEKRLIFENKAGHNS
jgi:hypothetical protein